MTNIIIRHDLPIETELWKRRKDLSAESTKHIDETMEAFGDENVLIVNNETWSGTFLESLSAGDWVQTTSMGYEAFPVETFRDRGILFSNAADNYTETTAEHTFSLILGLARNLPSFLEAKRNREWVQELGNRLTDLTGKQMTIVGLGNIGEAVAKRGKAFGMDVVGTKRKPDKYDGNLRSKHVYGADKLNQLLPKTDYLVLTVPLTEQTTHLIDENAITRLPETAFIINVARGKVVDQEALVTALDEDRIAGAGLDVFPEEPLSPETEHWGLDNVILTPHIGGRSESFVPRFVNLFLTNYERFQRDVELQNQIV